MIDAAAWLLFALAAAAADPPPPAPPPPAFTHLLRLDLGLASPIGIIGATYAISPTPRLVAEVGVGAGVSGLQLSLMPKLVFGSPTSRFVVGAGASLSIPGVEIVTNDGPFGSNQNERVLTPWINAEIGYDWRSPTGASFLIAGGATMALANGCAVGIDSCTNLYGLILPELRIGFGHWF